MEENKGNVIIYQSEDGVVRLDVRLEDKTVWLTIDQMAELFGKSRSTINEHILHIYEEGELEEDKTKRKIGNSDFSTKPTNLYNLDVIISVGYRVKSIQGTRFRQWATERLHEYIVKGFTLDDERLKNLGGGSYWKELLDRIRDIRSSEKVLYRQVLLKPPACSSKLCRTSFIMLLTDIPLLKSSMKELMQTSLLWD